MIPKSDNTSIERKGREETPPQVPVIISVIMGVPGIYFLANGIKFSSNQPEFTSHLIVSFCFLASAFFVLNLDNRKIIKSDNTRILMMVLGFQVSMIFTSALLENVGIPISLIVLTFTLFASISYLSTRGNNFAFTGGVISAILASLAGVFSPFRQIFIQDIPGYLWVALGLLILLYIVALVSSAVPITLQARLLITALVISLIPLAIISVILLRLSLQSLQAQNNNSLLLASKQAASAVDGFITTNLDSVAIESTFPVFADYLKIPKELRRGHPVESELSATLTTLQQTNRQAYLESIGILDINGQNVFDTNPYLKGLNESWSYYFQTSMVVNGPYVSLLNFDREGYAYIVFSSTIHDEYGRIVGLLRVRYQTLAIQRLLDNYINLNGQNSYPILLNRDLIRLADTIYRDGIYQPIDVLSPNEIDYLRQLGVLRKYYPVIVNDPMPEVAAAIKNYSKPSTFYTEVQTLNPKYPEAAAVTRLEKAPWYMVYIADQTDLYANLNRQSSTLILISTIIAGIVAFLATLLARVLGNPITQLTATAEKIAAGDLAARAKAPRTSSAGLDEINTLAVTFNSMAEQLSDLVYVLEARVAARTKELAEQNESLLMRTRQLQTVSDVARDIAAARELNSLLTSVTKLVSERFGYYHVGIFLLDEKGEYAILRAANSEGGNRMLARQHKLAVGQTGIVGYVTGHGEPRIALDVGDDPTFFNNPDLPNTRSEMALPLIVGEKIIGAMDVQSTESSAFSEKDLDLFSTLAYQVAIAIMNSRLYEETNRALDEMRKVHRQYLQREWAAEVSERQLNTYLYTDQGIVQQEGVFFPDVNSVLEIGEPYIQPAGPTGDGDNQPAVLAVPINLRGEVIGVIRLQDPPESGREWDDDDINAIRSVADQIATSLEITRLFEQTVRRAERERKALEITSKIRSTNDFQSMLQIAVNELQKSLKAEKAQLIIQQPGIFQSFQEGDNGHDFVPPDPDP